MNDGTSDEHITNKEYSDITIFDKSNDLKTGTHFSDGLILNATLWLLGNISKDPTQSGANSISYGVLVDVDNNPSTGRLGIDFKKETRWMKNNSNWINPLIEYSSSGD